MRNERFKSRISLSILVKNKFYIVLNSLTIMRRVTLIFPNTNALWAFAQTLRSEYIEINSTENKLTCNCSDGEISRALMQFNAKIVDEVEERTGYLH